MLPPILETERLMLRPWQRDDADDVVAYATHPAWSQFMPVPRPYRRADALNYIETTTSSEALGEAASFATVLEGRVIGGVHLILEPEMGVAEIGYSVAVVHGRRGYALESATAVRDAAFERLPWLHRLQAHCVADNLGSVRVAQRLGMREEGRLRGRVVFHGVRYDIRWFGLLREEWAQRKTGPSVCSDPP